MMIIRNAGRGGLPRLSWLAGLGAVLLLLSLTWATAWAWPPDLSGAAPSFDDKIPPPPKATETEGQTAQVDPEKELSLAELVDLALTYNPSTRSDWANAKAAAQSLGSAYSYYYPQAKLNYSVDRTRTGIKTWTNQDEYANTWGPTIDLTLMLLDMGGRRAGVEQAHWQLEAATLTYLQGVQDLLLNVQKAYYNYSSALAGVKSAQADLANAQQSLQVAETKYELGLAKKSDVLQARATQAQYSYQLETALGKARTAWVALALTTGLPHQPMLKIATPGEVDASMVKDKVDQLLALAMDNRADLKALKASVQAYDAAVAAADSKFWPTIDAGAEFKKIESSNQDLTVTEIDTIGFVELNYKFFTGFSDSYDRRKAVAQAWGARGKLAAQKLQVANDLVTQYQSYFTYNEQTRYAQIYLEQAEQSLQMQLGLYREGLANFVNVTSAQATLSNARASLVQAQAQVYLSLAGLAHACGALEGAGWKTK